MKIEKIARNQYKLLKLKLIKSSIYKKKHYLKNIKLEDVEYRLKKALYIIYSYHIHDKRILFVGNPLETNKEMKNLLKNAKHIFIPKSTWISGVITNQNTSFKSLLNKQDASNNKISKRLLQLKEKSDLVVIFDQELDNKALEESYTSRIPVISLNSFLNIFDIKSSYKVPGNYISPKNKLKNDFFCSILLSIFKKSNKIKRKFPVVSHKLTTTKVFKKPVKKSFNQKKFN